MYVNVWLLAAAAAAAAAVVVSVRVCSTATTRYPKEEDFDLRNLLDQIRRAIVVYSTTSARDKSNKISMGTNKRRASDSAAE